MKVIALDQVFPAADDKSDLLFEITQLTRPTANVIARSAALGKGIAIVCDPMNDNEETIRVRILGIELEEEDEEDETV